MAKSKATPEAAAAGRSSSKSRKSSPIGTTMMDLMFPNSFSELEMKVIELLVQLSTTTSGGGSASSEVSNYHHTDDEEITSSDAKIRAAAVHDDHHDPVSLSLSSSSSSSSESQKILSTEDVDDVGEDEVGLGLGQMRKKRFASVSELYELTEPLNNLNRKRKSMSRHASSRSS